MSSYETRLQNYNEGKEKRDFIPFVTIYMQICFIILMIIAVLSRLITFM